MKHQTFEVSIMGEMPDGPEQTEAVRQKLIQSITGTDFGFTVQSVGAKVQGAEEIGTDATQVTGRQAKSKEKL